MKARSQEVTESACRYCHEEIVHAIETPHGSDGEQLSCIRCHGSVGHPHVTLITRESDGLQFMSRKALAERPVSWPTFLLFIGVAALVTAGIAAPCW